MNDKTAIPNFSSENEEVQYFRYSPVSSWNLESYTQHVMENKRRKPALTTIIPKYKLCLNTIARFNDLSEDKLLVVTQLLEDCETLTQQQQQPQQQPQQPQKERPLENNYFYNYGTVGVQGEISGGTVSIIPSKREFKETEHGQPESSNAPHRRHFDSNEERESRQSLSPEELALNFTDATEALSELSLDDQEPTSFFSDDSLELSSQEVLSQELSQEEQDPPSYLSNTTDSSYRPAAASTNYGELYKQRLYILELNEFDDIDFKGKQPVQSMDYELSLDERLLLSSIVYQDNCPVELAIQPFAFSDSTYAELRRWRHAKITNVEYFPSNLTPGSPPIPEDVFQRNLRTFLVNLTETLQRRPPIFKNTSSEIDFTVQHVSILLRFVFDSKSMVNIAWENPSITNLDTTGRITTQDFLIFSDFQELGCGEIKVNNAGHRLEENDRARLGERMKKQLHHRIKQAKNTKEFHVFGMFISDTTIELYRTTFSVDKGYEMIKVKKITLPTLESTYTATAESLELLFTFKASIIGSMQNPEESEQPFIYRGYYQYMKPTITFI